MGHPDLIETQRQKEIDTCKFLYSADRADQRLDSLNTIANDLANMNTTGFKSQSVNFFRSLLSADRFNRIGRSDPAGVGYAGRVDRNGFLDRVSQFNRC